ncbi:MAG TPA: hypothetical protein VGJ22_12560 [Anaerolineales bacterium]
MNKPRLFVYLSPGLAVVLIALFAPQLGLDHDSAWGKGRVLILVVGILALLLGAAAHFYNASLQEMTRRHSEFVEAMRERALFRAAPETRARRITLGVIAINLLMALIYVWFVSVGRWTDWPASSNYYDMLATALSHGHIALETEADPALLALPDPYDGQARANFPFLWDMSLYNGKYYLYWGPAPALIAAGIKLIDPVEIQDHVIVFTACLGLLGAQTLLITTIWKRFYLHLPAWTLFAGILLAGLVMPITWMLNRPEIYEASIASAQFFLVAGVCFALRAFDRPFPSASFLSLASIFWVLAIGSRAALLVGILFLVILTLLQTLKLHRMNRDNSLNRSLLAFGLPMLLGGLALGWYNFARFGSVFDFGIKHQLTWVNFHQIYNHVASIQYFGPNLKNYLLTPFGRMVKFPFLRPMFGKDVGIAENLVPGLFHAEKLTGLVYSFPFFIFGLIPIALLLKDWLGKRSTAEPTPDLLRWIVLSLAAYVLLEFGALLLFFYSTMRYIADISPMLTVLALIGFWQGYEFIEKRVVWRQLYSTAALILIVASIVIPNLLAVSSSNNRFRRLNPELLERIDAMIRWER